MALRALAITQPGSSTPLSKLNRFLIVEHATALGSVIHATPLAEALRKAVPDARIYVLGSGFAADAFLGNPAIDGFWPVPPPTRQFNQAVSVMRQFIQRRKLKNAATLLPLGNERTAIGLALWRAGAGNRVGFTLTPELFRAPLIFDPALSQIANNLRMIEALGHPPTSAIEPRIMVDATALAEVRGLLKGRNEQRPLAVLVTQTSVTQRKSWRPERFIVAGKFLQQQFGAEMVFVGTESERAAVEAIRAGVGGTSWNLAGKTDLQQLAALLSLCDIGLTLDTGTLHVGRAVGLPMVILAPAWSPPIEWLPVENPRYIILKNADLPIAPRDYVIDEVSVDEVTAALAALLSQYPGR